MSRDVEILPDPRPVSRHTAPEDEKFGLEEPGFTVVSRRPRVRGLETMRPVEQATRIEGYMRPMPIDMGDY